jgi:hypothetical protein
LVLSFYVVYTTAERPVFRTSDGSRNAAVRLVLSHPSGSAAEIMAIRYEADIKEKYSRYAGRGRKSFGSLPVRCRCLRATLAR